MSSDRMPTGPDPEAISNHIRERYADVDVVSALGASFFSVDGEKHWPNFATIVTTDEHDEGAPSNLTARPDAFRLNIGVGRATFERLVGSQRQPNYAELDRIVPHPVYAKQRWISIVNPSHATFRDVILPLLDEAHSRVTATTARPAG